MDPFARFDLSRPSSTPEDPIVDQQRGAFPASTLSRWRQDALQPRPLVLQRSTGCDGCDHFFDGGLRCITWNTRRLVGSFLSKLEQRNQTQISQEAFWQQQHVMSLGGRYMEGTSISRLFRCWLHGFDCLVLSFLETKMQEDRLYAFTRILYPERQLWHIWLLVKAEIIL